MRGYTVLLTGLLLLHCNQDGWTQRVRSTGPSDSGGLLMAEQAAYDVTYYALDLDVSPAERAIAGTLTVHATIINPLEWLVLDLDTVFVVEKVELLGSDTIPRPVLFDNRDGKLWIQLDSVSRPGDVLVARVHYEGKPRVARRPPWSGGFTWGQTADGLPWIATSVQGEGADLWWPCKDHPSDEPDSMSIRVTVPEPLVVASNGRLRQTEELDDDKRAYSWFVSTPINNYGVALNIAPYRTIERTYQSTSGQEIPVTVWVLPERYKDAERILPDWLDQLAFYEKVLGPYPFRDDKYGVAHTPFLGMEHQTIIAYGSHFGGDAEGYDWLHHHELGHEWWGNMVTAADWRDFWIHEGFCTYMQALYGEALFGREGYIRELLDYRDAISNRKPLAPLESKTSDEMYFIDAGRGIPDNDIYYKGSWVLHTLRFLMGDETFFQALRRMAYPSPELENITDGRQCRFATTAEFHALAEDLSGKDLDWFFEIYFRQPDLPELVSKREGSRLILEWKTPDNKPFPMPVEVKIGDAYQIVDMQEGHAVLELPATEIDVTIDPNSWILKK